MGETSLKEMAVFSTSRTRLKTLASVQDLPPASQTLDYLLNTVGRSRQHARLFTQGFFSLPRPRAELQPWWLRFSAWSGAPSLVQGKASTHACRWVGFKAIPAFPTPANTLSVPGKHSPPSSENLPQDKARPSAQLAFSSLCHLRRPSYQQRQELVDGHLFSLPTLCSPHVSSSLCWYTMQMPHKFVQCSVQRRLNALLSC